jgi:hypothetical protein
VLQWKKPLNRKDRMDLKQKFLAVSTGKLINITDLDIGVRYPIVYAVQMVSSVLLMLSV